MPRIHRRLHINLDTTKGEGAQTVDFDGYEVPLVEDLCAPG